MTKKTYCMGVECSVRMQCKRYIDGASALVADGAKQEFFRKCINQKKFVHRIYGE